MKVEILSRKLITPSTPTPHHLRKLKISSFDQILIPIHVPCIFYYPATGEEQWVNNVERSQQVQKALSEILTIFYPLGGRYNEGNLFVDCNDEGAEYMETKVCGCGSLSQLLQGGVLDTELRNHLVPALLQPENSPLVIVQFNMFERGGVAIGLGVSHRIADGFTIFSFIEAWATACRIGVTRVHKPNFQVATVCPPKDISGVKTLQLPGTARDGKIARKRFVFSGAAISKLKAVTTASVNNTELLERKPTRVEVLTALLWRTFVMVAQAKQGLLRPSLLAHTFNMRGKTDLLVPEDSCGNFACFAIAQFMPDDESKMQLHDFVGIVQDAIRNTSTNCSRASNGDELLSILTDAIRKMNESFESGVDVYMFTSWSRFPIYEADFCWGKPDWVSSADIASKHVVTVMATRDGGGLEAWINLEEDDMLLFEQNPDIKTFTQNNNC